MMKHKGYSGEFQVDLAAGVIRGRVLGTRDVITFQGATVAEARTAFIESVDDYLAFCAERGEEPENPYSGRILLEISPELHRGLAIEADRIGVSFNTLVVKKLDGQTAGHDWRQQLNQAGLTELNCAISDVLDQAEIREIQLGFNARRRDLAPIEQARAWQDLIDEKKYTHAQLAAKLGCDRSTVTRAVGLLDLPLAIQADVTTGTIRPQTGYELSRVADPIEQARLAEEAKAGRLRRDDLKGRVKWKEKEPTTPSPAAAKPVVD